MKTSLKFWQNRFWTNFIIGGLLWSLPLSAQTPKLLGIFETFEKLVNLHQEKYTKKNSKLALYPKVGSDVAKIESPQLDPDFILSTLFRSPSRFFSFVKEDDTCSFYNLLLSNLLKTPQGNISTLMLQYKRKGVLESALVTQADFISQIVEPNCPQVIETNKSFTPTKIQELLFSLNMFVPQNKVQCLELVDQFSASPFAPYFCQVRELIKKESEIKEQEEFKSAKAIFSKIPPEKWVWIEEICDHLDQKEYLCQKLLNSNYWKTAIDRQDKQDYARYFCQQQYKTEKIDTPMLRKCLEDLGNNKDACLYLGTPNTALMPKPNCDSLSLAINYSGLKTVLKDCPAISGNEAITNVARLVAHAGYPIPQNPVGNCAIQSSAIFANFNTEADFDQAWKVSWCFQDQINEEEICYPSLMGSVDESALSEEKVIAKILYKTKGLNEDMKCKIISKLEYKPALLEYKVGCVLIYDPAKCTSIDCPKEIYYNDRIQNPAPKLKSEMNFDYFPNSMRNEKYSETTLFEKKLKKRKRNIFNFTILKTILQSKGDSLVHGIGCAEDLYPEFFSKKYMNQCHPLPFIIDGIVESDDQSSVVIRSAIDDQYSPRIIDWSYVFTSVKTYQKQQPMEIWTLYAFY